MNDLTFHPLAEMFPLIEGTEFTELVASIKENGLREAIITLDNQILDGRNRYRACRAAGVMPIINRFTGRDPVRFVIDKNINRRHLSESQRAMIGAQLTGLRPGQVLKHAHKMEAGSKEPAVLSSDQAAELMHVGRSSVIAAKTVLDHGTKEEIEAVRQGKIGVRPVANAIRAKVSPEKRKRNREQRLSNTGKNPDRIQTQQLRAQIWGSVRDAVMNLSGLPLPADVVGIVRAHDKSGLVDARLLQALEWLQRFADEWTSREARTEKDQDRNSHSDAGTGDGTSGPQSAQSAAA